MTRDQIQSIFCRRGYAAAKNIALACREREFQTLVERLEAERKLRQAGLKPAEIERRAAALAAARREEAAKKAADDAAFAASMRALKARFSRAA